jgi:hypothetical protein
MKNLLAHFCIALLLCLGTVGCMKREQAVARVRMPSGMQAQTQLMAYALSPSFGADVRARLGTNGAARFVFSVRQPTNTSLLELKATSNDSFAAAQAANAMATVLIGFAAEHNLGPVMVIDPAVPRSAR